MSRLPHRLSLAAVLIAFVSVVVLFVGFDYQWAAVGSVVSIMLSLSAMALHSRGQR